MLSAAKGSAEAGGKIIGVTCSAFGQTIANELGQGYVVLPGGTGTLLELAKIWELKNKGFLKKSKPIIIAGEFWKPLFNLIATDDPDSSRYIEVAAGPDEVKNLDFARQA